MPNYHHSWGYFAAKLNSKNTAHVALKSFLNCTWHKSVRSRSALVFSYNPSVYLLQPNNGKHIH